MIFTDKLITHNSVEELITTIQSDKSSSDFIYNRYPVRFIFLENFDTFRKLVSSLNYDVETRRIEALLPSDDGWITKDDLYNDIERYKKDVCFVPFSEIARFYDNKDFQNFFIRLAQLENNSENISHRIYLPLIGIRQRFESFFENYGRREEMAPIWSIEEQKPQRVSVVLTQGIPINAPEGRVVIKNTREWLMFWSAKHCPADIICCSSPISMFFCNTLPDAIFSPMCEADDEKKLIEEIHNISIPINYLKQDKSYWNSLLKNIDLGYSNFECFVKKELNVIELDLVNIINVLLSNTDPFKRWLLKHYILNSLDFQDDYYIKVIMGKVLDFTNEELIRLLYFSIFDININKLNVTHRKNYIFELKKGFAGKLSDDEIKLLEQKISTIDNLSMMFDILTGEFEFENKIIINAFNSNSVDSKRLHELIPEFSYYTKSTEFVNIDGNKNWIIDYIDIYKRAKLSDSFTPEIKAHIENKNQNEQTFFKWYHSFDSVDEILCTREVDKIIWIDGLGVEFVSLIVYYLNRIGAFPSIEPYIAISKLPTTTEINRKECSKKVEDMDKIIHDIYQYPNTIFEQIKTICKICDDISRYKGSSIAIVSDHGSSALSRLVPSKKYGKEDHHCGRFIEIRDKNIPLEDSDYVNYTNRDNNMTYTIALKHNSLGIKPHYEVHGGCTPEEVLVPVIFLGGHNATPIIDNSVSIEIIETVIKRSNPILNVRVSGSSYIVNAVIDGCEYKLKYDNSNNLWSIKLKTMRSGDYPISITANKITIESIITIKAAMQEEDLF